MELSFKSLIYWYNYNVEHIPRLMHGNLWSKHCLRITYVCETRISLNLVILDLYIGWYETWASFQYTVRHLIHLVSGALFYTSFWDAIFSTLTKWIRSSVGAEAHLSHDFSLKSSNLVETTLYSNSTHGHYIATKFCTCHDSATVVTCEKFCSSYLLEFGL